MVNIVSSSSGAFDGRTARPVYFDARDLGRRSTDPLNIGRSNDGCRRCGGDLGRGGNEQPESKCGEAAWWVRSRLGVAKPLVRSRLCECCHSRVARPPDGWPQFSLGLLLLLQRLYVAFVSYVCSVCTLLCPCRDNGSYARKNPYGSFAPQTS